jgi:hypothetical protein
MSASQLAATSALATTATLSETSYTGRKSSMSMSIPAIHHFLPRDERYVATGSLNPIGADRPA